MGQALDARHDEDGPKSAGLGGSAPRVARWLGDSREFFPATVIQVIHKDAFARKGVRQMLIEAEFLATVEADVHLVADLIALRKVMAGVAPIGPKGTGQPWALTEKVAAMPKSWFDCMTAGLKPSGSSDSMTCAQRAPPLTR